MISKILKSKLENGGALENVCLLNRQVNVYALITFALENALKKLHF